MATVIKIDNRQVIQKDDRLVVKLPRRVAPSNMRPFLAVASDDNLYWCKEIQNPDGYESIINEIVGSEIGKVIGAPVRDWKILQVPAELDRARVEKSKTLHKGPVFGTLDIHEGEVDLMDRGISFIDCDGNYQRVPKLIALWLLCNAQDLQVIFDHSDESRVYSIDHGLWFGSEQQMWELAPADMRAGQVDLPGLTMPIPAAEWDKAIEKVEDLSLGAFSDIMSVFPNEWSVKPEEVDQLLKYAIGRKPYTIKRLTDLKKRQERRA
ncbi:MULTISPECIES: HipA family kinase [Corynebacterium]|jgi:hypothetical protein|uniref:HipA family kinase n=1 Tax=Corynebacterium TaxID=1716 RepID=UPI0003B91C62|nr:MULTISPECIES: HipA family kinase [Corynebacterium]ERS39059.1 hypothetical protein HMPREF1293_02230 [Corynebacterium sp. KPL1996]ERS44892.1 hypothetical protein HMPREF1287_01400 [Corynebacterium sp. KPL1986]ERS69514.1 hypothetical protein HMPREF1300_02223 [Corynebacterium sp. KPL2004]ERS69857.1 hypothetical protein HMPREF1295_02223 [Corynebacterium sp. KPL1998]MCT1409896.1 hypothetical protein [Corynebacterium accolens]